MNTKRPLRCDMNEAEAREKAQTIARIVEERTKLEAEKKDKNKLFGDLIKEKHKRIDELAEDIRLGAELRLVEVEEVLDFRRNRVDMKRLDTEKIYDHRTMTPKERQVQFDLDKKAVEKKAKIKSQKPSAPARRAPAAKPENGETGK